MAQKEVAAGPITIGDVLPCMNLFENTPICVVELPSIAKILKRVIVFGVQGAFIPNSKTHLTGYIKKANELKSKGISEIFCVSVNDPFVMNGWGRINNASGKVRMLADPETEFTKAIGLDIDIEGLGIRSKHYSMYVENGIVKKLNVEPNATELSCSLAANIQVEMTHPAEAFQGPSTSY